MASRFILTPLIIGALGFEGYGVWALVFSVAAYVSMANASFGLAYTKFTAECVLSGEYDRLARIVGSGIVGIGGIALLGLGASVLWGESIMRLLRTPEVMVADAGLALVLVMVALVLRMTVGCCHEILSGLQRMDLASKLTIVGSLLEFSISVPLLLGGYGLVGLAAGHLAGYGTTNLIAYALVRKHAPALRVSPLAVSREGFAAMLGVGGRFQVLMAVNTLAAHGAKFVISVVIGTFWVGVYNLADRLLELGRAASAAIVAPLLPAFADTQARGDDGKERVLFLKGSKADAVFGGGALSFLAVFAPSVVLIWTGERVPAADWAVPLLAAGDGLFILTSVISSNLRARGQIRLEMTAALIATALGLGLMIPGMLVLGFAGAVYARLFAQVVAAPYYLLFFLRRSGIGLREYVEGTRILQVAAALAVSIAVCTAGTRWAPVPDFGLSARWQAVAQVTVWGAVFLALFAALAWRWALDGTERARLRTIPGKLRVRLGR